MSIYIQRQLEIQIKPFLKRKEVISIIGPRQAGKTTFIKHLADELEKQGKKVKFITFEKREDLNIFQDDIEAFKILLAKFDYCLIDEFQYAKEGGQKLKYLYDTSKTKFIISGSSSLDLTFQTGKYMVGRIFNFELLPFSFREFLSVKDKELREIINEKILIKNFLSFKIKQGFGDAINNRINNLLEEYFIYGGYPAVILTKRDDEKIKILQSISENYLLKDIASLLKLATEDGILKLQKALSAQIGNLINYNELSNLSGLAYKDLLKHLNILEKTYIIKLLKPFFKNRRIEISKNPKAYYFDLGMRNYLINDFRKIKDRNDIGAVAENYCLNMFQKNEMNRDLKYWRTKSQAEVDFIIEKNQEIIPVEVKFSSNRIVGKSLHSFIDKFSSKKAIILTKDYLAEEKIGGCRVQFIPMGYF